ncbi:RNA 2',3'-cyclic phosphodiesterase [Geothrix rubra]|uniref:RNA 2',3'-cyclic phosphodiesterase n=1 Tax=Geothrix rubra TaxID=2927977 RepID=A0ABQ5Q649_9BACT|nr:RNA 2',3'-cyclic phosphodiesterase [Geothrix rubra]GLH69979.1 RNA 2',3'-cyclic phosphodiesterase [Geothrix rubra]
MRLFLALPLPPDPCETLDRWQRSHPGIEGWSRPGGLHLTLAFLGARAPEDLDALARLGAAVAVRQRPFELATTHLGGFPAADRARVLWLGVAPSAALEALAGDLRSALAAAGEAFDAKPFRAHLTLARFRRARPVAAFADPPAAAFAADRLVLFESAPQGCYTPLRTWPFRGV